MRRVLLAVGLAMLPALAGAQQLDFDSVCASPPCAIGTLYAASGVTFAPSSVQIVAAGTNDLTGNAGGGRYLSIDSFPYQVAISLARPATFLSMQLARAGTSSGTVTVNITWLKAGNPVGSTSVVLDTVNAWSNVAATAAGSFDSVFIIPTGGANLSFGIDGLQFGGGCNGFADVQPADVYCSAAEWLANRSVTLGCAAGQYCPNQNVTRAQMALFMQRLGDTLTPVSITSTETIFATFEGIPSSNPICMTDPIPATSYQRQALVLTSLVLTPSRIALAWDWKTLTAAVLVSIDGGTIWALPGPYAQATLTSATQSASTSLGTNAVVPMAAGVTYRLAIGLASYSSDPYVDAQCQLIAQIGNARSGASAPFDQSAGTQGGPR